MLNLRWINALSIAGIHPGSMTAYIPPKNNHYLEVSNTSRNWNSVMLPRMIRICWMTQEKEATSICHFLPFSANASTISGMWWQKAICSFTHQSHTLHFWPWKGPHKPANSGLLLEQMRRHSQRERKGDFSKVQAQDTIQVLAPFGCLTVEPNIHSRLFILSVEQHF